MESELHNVKAKVKDISSSDHTLAKMKMDELFIQWLAQRETNDLIQKVCHSLNNGETIISPPMPSLLASLLGSISNSNSNSSYSEITSPDRRNNRSPILLNGSTAPPRSPTHRSHNVSPRSGNINIINSSNIGGHHQIISPCLSPELHSVKKTLEMDSDPSVPSVPTISSPNSNNRSEQTTTSLSQSSPPPVSSKIVPLLPSFYQRGEGGRGRGKKIVNDSFEYRKNEIENIYHNHKGNGGGGLNEEQFLRITKDLISLPGLLNGPLMRRINQLYDPPPQQQSNNDHISGNNNNNNLRLVVKLDALKQYWINEIEPYDLHERFFRLCKKINSNVIMIDDLCLLVNELLLYHPGLAFLSSHNEFMEKYSLTVAIRIMYSVNYHRNGVISLKEFRLGDVLKGWQIVDMEDDINRCTMWFSYEHFYVLYCRFWELDSDHDGMINREDLLRYAGHSMSRVIVDQVFNIGYRPINENMTLDQNNHIDNNNIDNNNNDHHNNKPKRKKRNNLIMKYDDFIYFMLSEEDKGNIISLKYWFHCVDIDGDGIITPMDMKIFYDVQSARMEALGHDVVSFQDVICQMNDMIKPNRDRLLKNNNNGSSTVTSGWLLSDLTRYDVMKQSGVVFDALFNLDKFVGFEQRDPFAERHKRDDPFDCDWDRFAYAE